VITGDLSRLGWCQVGQDPALAKWISAVTPTALAIAEDPAEQAKWLRHGGTWFAGVNALPNDAVGAIGQSGPLCGRALDLALQGLSFASLDRAQISVCYPGYPQQDPTESDAAHRYRRNRDAAHLDGLIGKGEPKRRFFEEYHAFILGLPLTDPGPEAAPFVVWEGSHDVMREMLQDALRGVAPEDWADVDLTEPYQAARRHVFEHCPRTELYAQPGAATLVHRFAIHGVAPWRSGTGSRAILYFRPPVAASDAFLTDP